MERFAFKIDNALKASLFKICRLCGVDHHIMVPILDANKSLVPNEPDLYQKIYELIGFTVHRNDSMPQKACAPCVEKINDFFDFREMCYNTDSQTRKLLGVKPEEINKDIASVLEKRGRKRKTEEPVRPIGPPISAKKVKLMEIKIAKKSPFACEICQEELGNDKKLNVHLIIKHSPKVPRYYCYACDHELNLPIDVKNHDSWHKKTHTPFVCGFCNSNSNNRSAFKKHMRTIHGNQNLGMGRPVPDRICPSCKENYRTPLLYNIHTCAIKTNQCGGCNNVFRFVVDLQRHIPRCSLAYKIYAMHIPMPIIEMKPQLDELITIKNEAVVGEAERSFGGTEAQQAKKANKKGFNNKDFKRVDDLLRATMSTLESIKHEPESNTDNNMNDAWQHGNYNYGSQFQDDDDDDDERPNEPIVQLSEGPSNEFENAQSAENELPIPRLKIKKEHGTLNSSVISNDESNVAETSVAAPEPMETESETRQHGEINESNVNPIENSDNSSTSGIMRIKQERLTEGEVVRSHGEWNNTSSLSNAEPIGMSSMRISNVTSGIEFKTEPDDESPQQTTTTTTQSKTRNSTATTQDIKPSISALNAMLNVRKPKSLPATHRRVVVKTEPMDRPALPRITSVLSGVSMSGLLNIKTEIKSEPYDENWQKRADYQSTQQNITIKQERVSIKAEPRSRPKPKVVKHVEANKASNTNAAEATTTTTNDDDDQEVIIMEKPHPFINLVPDIEIINLDSPEPPPPEDDHVDDTIVLDSPEPATPEDDHVDDNPTVATNSLASEEKESCDEITSGTSVEIAAEKEENPGKEENAAREENTAMEENAVTEENTATEENSENTEEDDNITEIQTKETDDDMEKGENNQDEENVEPEVIAEIKENLEAVDNEKEANTETASIAVEEEDDELISYEEKLENDNAKDESKEEEKVVTAVIENVGSPIVEKQSECSNLALPIPKSKELEKDDSNLEAEQQNEINQQMDNETVKMNAEEEENELNERVDSSSNLAPLHDSTTCTSISDNGNNNSSSSSNSLSYGHNNAVLFDNSNINEIAENNNNANIERELLEVIASSTTTPSDILPEV